MPPGIIRFIVAAKDTGNKDFNTDADQDSKVNRRDNISGELVGDMTYNQNGVCRPGMADSSEDNQTEVLPPEAGYRETR